MASRSGTMPETGVYLVLPWWIALLAAVLDVVRRIEVRLADRQADHVPPLGFEIPRLLRDHDRRRRLDAGKGVRQKAHWDSSSRGVRRGASRRRGP